MLTIRYKLPKNFAAMKIKTKHLLICPVAVIGVLFFFFFGCEEPEVEYYSVPEMGFISLSRLTSNSLEVSGSIVYDGGLDINGIGLVWSTSENPTLDNNEGEIRGESAIGDFSFSINGLLPATQYNIRAWGTNKEGTAYSNQVKFITGKDMSVVSTAEVTGVSPDSATSGGNVEADGGAAVTLRGIVWSTSENPAIDNNEGKTEDGEGLGEFISRLGGLASDTTYYVRAFATNSEGTSYGDQKSFITSSEPVVVAPPTVITAVVTDITHNSATSGGSIELDGGAAVTARGIVWSTSENPATDNNEGMAEEGEGTGEYTGGITGLAPETTYYVRAWATNSEGTSYGNQESFITESEPVAAELPAVVTADVSNITHNSATSGGYVEYDGGAPVTARGIVWSTSENPETDNNEGITEDGEGQGDFISQITGLTAETYYYVRAYATNSAGTAYGSQHIFSSESEPLVVAPPTVITTDISDITYNSATSGGIVELDGGAEVVARGVVWGLSQDPLLEKCEGFTDNGTGTGSFTSNLTGIAKSGTVYYVRAYAENSAGVSYGENVKFKTYDGIVADIDKNIYNTVIIGGQEWMAENLKTTALNDETVITEAFESWETATYPAYSWYGNNQGAYKDAFGALYNFYSVATGKLCPDGWRVPTQADWSELIEYVGGQEVAAGKLKSLSYWIDPNEGAVDEYRFSALPGGFRNGASGDETAGDFMHLYEAGAWWAYYYIYGSGARTYLMAYTAEFIGITASTAESGLSVRCLKGLQGEMEYEGEPIFINPGQ